MLLTDVHAGQIMYNERDKLSSINKICYIQDVYVGVIAPTKVVNTRQNTIHAYFAVDLNQIS